MQRIAFLFISFIVIVVSEIWLLQPLFSQEAALEEYSVSHGGTSETDLSGFSAKLSDKYFGNGTAKASVTFKMRDDSGTLSLKVWRKVAKGEITFALLVFRIEIRGYDYSDTLVYSQDLDGFTFGDSQSGNWSKHLKDLPVDIQQIKITFFGNYE
ncbi:MAG: hypothetical protein FJ266_07060 [Planctomycetes bacterium]|nr:hypothetical protein [Planctomycetota bacterium]